MEIRTIFILIYLLAGIGGFIGLVYMHEMAHKEIFRSYGIESKIEMFSHFPYAVTIPEKGCEYDTCILAHDINDAIGYHLLFFYCLFFISFAWIIFYLDLLSEWK